MVDRTIVPYVWRILSSMLVALFTYTRSSALVGSDFVTQSLRTCIAHGPFSFGCGTCLFSHPPPFFDLVLLLFEVWFILPGAFAFWYRPTPLLGEAPTILQYPPARPGTPRDSDRAGE